MQQQLTKTMVINRINHQSCDQLTLHLLFQTCLSTKGAQIEHASSTWYCTLPIYRQCVYVIATETINVGDHINIGSHFLPVRMGGTFALSRSTSKYPGPTTNDSLCCLKYLVSAEARREILSGLCFPFPVTNRMIFLPGAIKLAISYNRIENKTDYRMVHWITAK